MIRKHQRFFNIMQVLFDATSLLLAYTASILLKLRSAEFAPISPGYIFGPLWMVPLLLVVYYFMGVYSPMRIRMYRKEVLIITRAHLVGIVIIFCALFLRKSQEFSREVSLLFAALGLLFLLFERFIVRRSLRHLRQSGYNLKHMLIIGAGPVGMDFARRVQAHRDFGYNVMGFLDDDEAKLDDSIVGRPVLGGCAMLPELLENQAVDEVVVTLPLNAYEKYGGIVEECEKAGVRIRIIPDYYKFLPGTPMIEEFDGIPLLNVRNIPLDDPFNRFLKRLFDIFVSAIAIILTGPVMICIALGIKFTSPGPVFFRQEQVGLNNHPFDMLKFRSMRVGNDTTAATTWTTADDPRKTNLGLSSEKPALMNCHRFLMCYSAV